MMARKFSRANILFGETGGRRSKNKTKKRQEIPSTNTSVSPMRTQTQVMAHSYSLTPQTPAILRCVPA